MHKLFFLSLFVVTMLSGNAQKVSQPNKVKYYGPVEIQSPILLDSMSLSQEKFSDRTLLESQISFPDISRFSTELTPDSSGFFHLTKPQRNHYFHLISFFVSADGYGKGKIKVTSPNMLEIYVNNERKNTKTGVSDSLKNAGSLEHAFNGFVNSNRIVIKLLSSANDKIDPAVKIEFQPEKSDSLLAYSFATEESRWINITDILDGTRVLNSSISPSGNMVLLRLAQTLPGGKRNNFVQVYEAKSDRIIFSEKSDRSQLAWMPKSDLLSYVSDGENGKTMFTLNPLTSEEKIIAENLPDENFSIAPDEKSMFFSKKNTLSVSNPTNLKRLLAPDDRQPNYRNRYFIYRYFFDSGLIQQITYGKESAWINDISADGKNILFSTGKELITERPFRTSSMHLLKLESMQIDTLWSDEKYASTAQFSPDGKQILITGGGESFNGIGLNIVPNQTSNSYNTVAYIMDLKTKKIDPITKNFNPTINSAVWSKNNHIYFCVSDKDCENVYTYDPKAKNFEKLPLREEVVRSFSIADNGLVATYTGQSQNNANRSYLINLKNKQSNIISDPYAERLSKLKLGEVKSWNFKSKSGDTIEGRYYLPPNFDASKKYPLIVYYYGGTSPTQRVFESTYPLHVYAAQGFVVYTLNPSGTTGYGQEFAARHVNAWGIRTADEIIEGTRRFATAHPFVDAAKIGCIGASYGGFMTQYLQTQTDLFAAAVSHAGISNIASYWGEGYWGYLYSGTASAGSYPWNNPDLYVRQSPLFRADKINTPLLLLHGTADTNVPIGESIQMYIALKILNKPVEFIQVESENHAIYDYDKRIQWNYAIYAWFTKWLKGDSRWWDSMYGDK